MVNWSEMSEEERRKAVEGSVVKGTVLRDLGPLVSSKHPIADFYEAYKKFERPRGPYMRIEDLYSISIAIAQVPREKDAKIMIRNFVAQNGNPKAKLN
ncbi:MAG TPA: hypothetical protein VF189_02785 [Patescibacteria group bacterium]